MKENSFTQIITELTNKALWEVKNVIDCVPDDLWTKHYCEMPMWKHIYHMLHSLDQWYINPSIYNEPNFHIKDMNNLDIVTESILSREEINNYYDHINHKIQKYNYSLNDENLLKYPEKCNHVRFTYILAQHRHLHSHMGMIMGFIIEDTGRWPYVLGLNREIPTGEYNKYF